MVIVGEGYVDTIHGAGISKGIHPDSDNCIGVSCEKGNAIYAPVGTTIAAASWPSACL